MAHRGWLVMVAAVAAVGLAACAPTSPRPGPTRTASAAPSVQPTPAPPSASPTSPIPVGFQPHALSAISESQFWVLGGEGCTTSQCPPEILHTVDSGRTFQRVPAPPMVFLYGNVATPGYPSVFDLRFADASNGWLFGGQLWATHDGGAHWRQVAPGLTARQVEPGANGYVYAVLEACPSSGASPCVERLMRSRSGTDAWSDIAPPGSPRGSPVIGVHGDTLWVMYFGGSTGSEWISHDDGRSFARGAMPCAPDLAGLFDPVSISMIWAFCATGNFGQPWLSTDGGVTFSVAPSATSGGGFTNGAMVAALSSRRAFVVDAVRLAYTNDGGGTFHSVPQLAGALWGGFTDSEVGYVITNDQTSGDMRLWRTTDAGADWTPVALP
jgi:hypothetical protein